jgi:hypothetical protein
MAKIIWKRPSGTTLETTDIKATVEYLEGLGWEREKEVVKPTRKKK